MKQDVNKEWINIKNVILEAAKEDVREQRKERNQDWYDEECQMAMKEKNYARKKCQNKETRKNRKKYEEKRKIEEIKGATIKKKESFIMKSKK